MSKNKNRILSETEQEELIETLKIRFEKNNERHPDLNWNEVEERLRAQNEKLWSLYEMEHSGGEPDVVDYGSNTQEFIFFDCSPESPGGRRSVCYDKEGQESRKKFKPENNALDMAQAMQIDLLTEKEYMMLQKLGSFDTKTSRWLKTPEALRKKGGAIFGDKRFGRVFIYHNGAQSYYGARGFRGILRV